MAITASLRISHKHWAVKGTAQQSPCHEDMEWIKKFCRSVIGLLICSLGTSFLLAAGIGLSPWETLNEGISNTLSVSYGAACMGSAFLVVGADVLLKEKIGVSTILDVLLVGTGVDFFQKLLIFPISMHLSTKLLLLELGMLVVALGQTVYMSSGLGCGPRDMLLLALTKRARKLQLGAVSCILLGTVLFVGILLGAKTGIGTLITTFGGGWCLQMVSGFAGLNLCEIEQESLTKSAEKWRHAIREYKICDKRERNTE